MTETLLSPSNVLLFGRKVEDLEVVPLYLVPSTKFAVRLAYKTNVVTTSALTVADQGIRPKKGMMVLLAGQITATENGIYKLNKDLKVDLQQVTATGDDVYVRDGISARSIYKAAAGNTFTGPTYLTEDPKHSPFPPGRTGLASEIEQQLDADMAPVFARIYGYSFEGTYYDLSRPALFLVHGEGYDFTDPRDTGKKRFIARSPAEPSTSGLGAADFDFTDNVKVWSYDKADYTIRMDVDTGMFEQVLLDGSGGGASMSGARVSGARVSGARVSGARVSGARLSGGRGDAGD